MSKAEDKKETRKYARGQHPNSRRNLKPVEAGEVRNPEGRGSVPDRATVFRKWMETMTQFENPAGADQEKLHVSLYDAAALGQLMSAMKGNTQAWREIQDSLHGKQSDKMEVGGPNGGPIEKRVIFELIDGDSTANITDEEDSDE